MYKKILFGSSSESYLELKPAVGDSDYVTSLFGSSATIVSRREYVFVPVTPRRREFVGNAETVNALYSTLNGSYGNDVFFTVAASDPPIKNSDGTSDPVYTPVDLNDLSVAYNSSSNDISGDLFKFEVIGNQFRIVQKDEASQLISTPTDVTFTIPRFFTRDEVAGKNYVSILTITAPVTVVEIPLPVTNITTTPLEDIPTEYLTKVSWTASPSATVEFYRVLLTTTLLDGTPMPERIVNTETSDQTQIVIPDPYPDSIINVSVWPKTDSGTEGIVATYSFTVPSYVIPQVTVTSVIRDVANTLTVNWEYLRDPLMTFMVHVYDHATDLEYTNSYVDKTERSTVLTDIPAGLYYIVVDAIDYNGTDGRKTTIPFTGVEVVNPSAPTITLVKIEYGDGADITWQRNTLSGTFNINVLDNSGTLVGSPYPIVSTAYTGTITIRSLAVGVYGFQPEIILADQTLLTGSTYPENSITGIGPTPVVTSVSANGYVATIVWAQDFGTSFAINVSKGGKGYTTYYSNSEITRSYSMTFTEAGVYSFQIDATIYDGMADTSRTYSGPMSSTITLPGGGSGGGGGNNGDTGHNNMATLEFSYDGYTGSVSQNNTITVLGEEGGALVADEQITVHVTPEELSKVLAYSSNWTTAGDAEGEQPRPDVKFRPVAAVGAKLDAMFAQLKALGSGAAGSSGRQWSDDASVAHSVFGDHLLGLTFTGSALDDDELPREAIRKIEEGPITASELTTVVSDLDSTATGAPKALLEGLFEQAVSASKVSITDGDHPEESGYKKPTFVAGDSLSFLVKYDFSKTRTYQLDTDVAPGNTTDGAKKSITITGTGGNVVFSIDGGVETSDAFDRVYEIKLLAVAPA